MRKDRGGNGAMEVPATDSYRAGPGKKSSRTCRKHAGKYAEHSMLVKFVFILEHFGAKQLESNVFIAGPGKYRKAGER